MYIIHYLLDGIFIEIVVYILFVACLYYQNGNIKINYNKVGISIGVFWAVVKIADLIGTMLIPESLVLIYALILTMGKNCLRIYLLFYLYKVCTNNDVSIKEIWKRLNNVAKRAIPTLIIFSGLLDIYMYGYSLRIIDKITNFIYGSSYWNVMDKIGGFSEAISWFVIIGTATSLLLMKPLRRDSKKLKAFVINKKQKK